MNIIRVPFVPFIFSSETNSLFIDLSLKSSAFLPKSQIGVLVKAILYYKSYKIIIQQFYDL